MFYLYLKQHNTTGLKYLGQTKSKNPHLYLGSGKRWRNHLKKHGNDVKTSILLFTHCKEELKETGIFFSKLFNIVEDSGWANLKEETGDGGWDYLNDYTKQENIDRARKAGKASYTKHTKDGNQFGIRFKTGDSRTMHLSKKANEIKIEKLQNDLEYKKSYYHKVSDFQKENNSMKDKNWCVPINCIDKNTEKKVYHKDEIPDGWITCNEYNELRKDKNNPAYGRMWIHNNELRINKYISKNDEIPSGWLKGRKMKF